MCLCSKKKKPIDSIPQNKMTRRDSNGELIFEDIQNIRQIIQNRNCQTERPELSSKIESNVISSVYNI